MIIAKRDELNNHFTLWARMEVPSEQANVTSTKLSSCSSWLKTPNRLDWWLFHRRQYCSLPMFGDSLRCWSQIEHEMRKTNRCKLINNPQLTQRRNLLINWTRIRSLQTYSCPTLDAMHKGKNIDT